MSPIGDMGACSTAKHIAGPFLSEISVML